MYWQQLLTGQKPALMKAIMQLILVLILFHALGLCCIGNWNGNALKTHFANAQIPTIHHQSKTLKYISSHKKCTVCTVHKPPSKAALVLTAAESGHNWDIISQSCGKWAIQSTLVQNLQTSAGSSVQDKSWMTQGKQTMQSEAMVKKPPYHMVHMLYREATAFYSSLEYSGHHITVQLDQMPACVSLSLCLCILEYQKKPFETKHPVVLCVRYMKRSKPDFRKLLNELMR